MDSHSTSPVDNYFASGSVSMDLMENLASESLIDSSLPADSISCRLNDDCIIKILEYLPLRDLCSVADVCRGFAANAVSVFKRYYADVDLDGFLDESDVSDSFKSLDSTNTSDRFMEFTTGLGLNGSRIPLPMQTVERLFRHFGAYIQTIYMRVNDEDQEDEIWGLMTTYCTETTAKLNKLTMHDISIDWNEAIRLKPLFNRLKFLDVSGSYGAICVGSELTELTLEDVSLDEFVTFDQLQLQALTLIDVRDNDGGEINSLMKWVPHLKCLSISGDCDKRFLYGISELRLLEELRLDTVFDLGDSRILTILSKFQHLKVFGLNCMWFSITETLNNFVQQNVPIEELYLRNCTIGQETAANLAKLTKIKKLSLFNGGWQSVQFASVVKGMPMLGKLCLCDFGNGTMDDIKAIIASAPKLIDLDLVFTPPQEKKVVVRERQFTDICRLLAKRSDNTKLNLTLSGDKCKLDVPADIVRRNSLWLDVKVISFKDDEPSDVIAYYGFSDDSDETVSSVSSDDAD